MGIVAGGDVMMCVVLWELRLVHGFVLVKVWSVVPHRQCAVLEDVIYMLVGSARLIMAMVMLGLDYGVAVAAGTAPAGAPNTPTGSIPPIGRRRSTRRCAKRRPRSISVFFRTGAKCF